MFVPSFSGSALLRISVQYSLPLIGNILDFRPTTMPRLEELYSFPVETLHQLCDSSPDFLPAICAACV